MILKPNQMYLESQGLYQKVCRLAQVRVQLKALQVEADNLEQQICDAMCPATELVDVLYLRTQKGLSDAELSELFVARKEQDGSLTVHPAYVSERFRPGGTLPDILPGDSQQPTQQMELFPELVEAETEEEREGVLPPAPLSPQEKEEEREAAVIPKEKDDDEEKGMVLTGGQDDINVRAFIKFFNDIMANAAIPKIATLSGERLKALHARCREHGKSRVIEVLRRASRIPFLNGAGDKGWVASLDWLLRPNNFSKVMEGAYTDFKPKKPVMSPERQAANKAIEQQCHEELWQSIEQRERNCVTYEEYLRLKEQGDN